jgi:hypothetical protein
MLFAEPLRNGCFPETRFLEIPFASNLNQSVMSSRMVV